jgi:DNA-binding XRE family transcriptional regulator
MDKMRARLRLRIAALGLTNAEVARRAGVNPTMIRDLLDRNAVPSVENAAKIARAVGYTLQQLYEGESTLKMNLNVDGITRGQSMWAKVSERHARVVPITVLSEDTVSVEIAPEDEALAHGFRRGDVVSGQKIKAPFLSNVVGRECIIMTTSNDQYIGVLLKGSRSDTFDIRPLDVRQQEARDLSISWAAPITLIIRGA